MIPPHLQSIFKSPSLCSVSDDWLPSFPPENYVIPPKILQPPASSPAPPRATNDDWSFTWINKDPGSLLGWSAGYVEVTQIRRKSASSGQLSFSLVKMQSNLTVSFSVKILLAKTEHSSLTQDVPLKCWRKKSRGLPRRDGHVDAVNSTMICSRLAFLPSARDIPLHLPETDIKLITNMSKWVGSFFANFLDKVQITSF